MSDLAKREPRDARGSLSTHHHRNALTAALGEKTLNVRPKVELLFEVVEFIDGDAPAAFSPGAFEHTGALDALALVAGEEFHLAVGRRHVSRFLDAPEAAKAGVVVFRAENDNILAEPE
jgi:hypothetical protein